jgi:tetrahydromethanopterin S-methyltransferase subunit G
MRTQLWISLLLTAPLFACANNPNKELKEAKAAEAEAAREQRVEAIEEAKDNRIDRIEKRTDQMSERAENVLPEGAEQRAKAQAEMIAARQTFQANAQAKLHKAAARLDEVKRKMEVAGGRVPLSLRDEVTLMERERASLAADLGHLPMVTNDRWGEETKRIESRLDALESSVDSAQSRVDDLR